jgi:hypothetical protein
VVISTRWSAEESVDALITPDGRSRVRRLIAGVGLAALLAVSAAPQHPYVKSITCDRLRGEYTNCQVRLWDRHQARYVTYPVTEKRQVFCFDQKLTDCVLRVWHPRLEKYRFYWGLSVDITRLHGNDGDG